MSSTLLYILGIVIFVIALSLSVALHEFAHFATAKLFKARVSEFFIGFGPKLWSFRKGETEYGLKLIPAGGYVKIDGMVPPNAPGVEKPKRNFFKKVIWETKENEYKSSEGLNDDRLFYKTAWWKKTIVMASGATTNLLIAFVCFFSIFAFYGMPEQVIPDGPVKVASITECVQPGLTSASTECEPTPAAKAGLEAGDVINTVNGLEVTSWQGFIDDVNKNYKNGIELEITRGSENLTLKVNPIEVSFKDTVLVGITTNSDTVMVKHGAIYTLQQMGEFTKKTGEAIINFPSKISDLASSMFNNTERSPDGLISIVGAAQISGDVMSNDTSSSVTTMDRLMSLVSIIGSFNLAIALFNFIPLPPLDGGQMFGALFEGIKRGYSKLKKVSVKPFDASLLVPISYVTTFLLIAIGLFLVTADLVSPVDLFSNS